MSSSFLVTGATGQQGGGTARQLLTLGAKVHALVRDPTSEASRSLEALGATIFKGDFLDIDSIRAAVSGVTGVFLNTFGIPPNPYVTNTEIQQAKNVIAAALETSTVKTMVVSTVVCANRHDEFLKKDPNYKLAPYYSVKQAVEEAVRGAKFQNYTVLRPAWLMHNYLDFMPRYNWPDLEVDHTMEVSYSPTDRIAHLDPQDVGKFAAAALLEPEKYNRHEIDLGAENLTLEDVAKVLSDASGIKITAKFRSLEETKSVTPDQVPGILYQLHMVSHPNVYEVDVSKIQKYAIRTTTFAEYFARETEGKAIRRTLNV